MTPPILSTPSSRENLHDKSKKTHARDERRSPRLTSFPNEAWAWAQQRSHAYVKGSIILGILDSRRSRASDDIDNFKTAWQEINTQDVGQRGNDLKFPRSTPRSEISMVTTVAKARALVCSLLQYQFVWKCRHHIYIDNPLGVFGIGLGCPRRTFALPSACMSHSVQGFAGSSS